MHVSLGKHISTIQIISGFLVLLFLIQNHILQITKTHLFCCISVDP
jgi:chromatin segregation and condensation protein Rec8/ScpA/Scc1 (kleisin family)